MKHVLQMPQSPLCSCFCTCYILSCLNSKLRQELANGFPDIVLLCVQLGNPAQGSNPLVLCDSQDIRLSFSPLSEKTDCWHRCTIYDIVRLDTEKWVRDVADDVRQEIEDRVGLRWCVADRMIAIQHDVKTSIVTGTLALSYYRTPACHYNLVSIAKLHQ